jgi:hypothetical protein
LRPSVASWRHSPRPSTSTSILATRRPSYFGPFRCFAHRPARWAWRAGLTTVVGCGGEHNNRAT